MSCKKCFLILLSILLFSQFQVVVFGDLTPRGTTQERSTPTPSANEDSVSSDSEAKVTPNPSPKINKYDQSDDFVSGSTNTRSLDTLFSSMNSDKDRAEKFKLSISNFKSHLNGVNSEILQENNFRSSNEYSNLPEARKKDHDDHLANLQKEKSEMYSDYKNYVEAVYSRFNDLPLNRKEKLPILAIEVARENKDLQVKETESILSEINQEILIHKHDIQNGKSEVERKSAESALASAEGRKKGLEKQISELKQARDNIEFLASQERIDKRISEVDRKLNGYDETLIGGDVVHHKGIDKTIKDYNDAIGELDKKISDETDEIKKNDLLLQKQNYQEAIKSKEKEKERLTQERMNLESDKRWAETWNIIAGKQGGLAVGGLMLRFLGSLLSGYSEYQGIAQFGSLFISSEELNKKRAQINQDFCDTILLGGTQCWASKICEGYVDSEPSAGLLVSNVIVGDPKVTAHIEGERSLPTEFVDESGKKIKQWTYKITYYVSNAGSGSLSYNVEFAGPKYVAKYFSSDVVLESGEGDGRLGSTPILKPSTKDYNKICLTLNPAVTSVEGRKVDKVCNDIKEFAGAAGRPYTAETRLQVEPEESSTPVAGSKPAAKPREGEAV